MPDIVFTRSKSKKWNLSLNGFRTSMKKPFQVKAKAKTLKKMNTRVNTYTK